MIPKEKQHFKASSPPSTFPLSLRGYFAMPAPNLAFLLVSPGALTARPSLHTPKGFQYHQKHCTPQASLNSPTSKIAAATAAVLAATVITSIPLDITQIPPTPIIPPAHAARGGGASFLAASGDVIKDPESLLRWSLPVNNRPIREIQTEFEGAVADIKGLKWAKIDQHVKRGMYVLNNQSAKILTDVPGSRAEQATALLEQVAEGVPQVEAAVNEKNTEKLTLACKSLLRKVGDVEQLMVTDFPFTVPEEYSNLPQLKGRATVEMLVKKADDEPFDINGILYKEGKMTLVLDGYSAPLSAGAFLDLVSKGFYDGNPVIRSDGFIIQAGKPKDGEGFADGNTGLIRNVPLEVFAKGDKQPTYGITLEDDGRGAVGTVLPFTSYGTLALARTEFEPNSASSQFFWFLFEPDLTPAGRNLMDGSWAVFGYTTEGESFLKGLQMGDCIVSAKVVDGLENLAT